MCRFRRPGRAEAPLILGLLLAACATGRNYTRPEGPGYGAPGPTGARAPAGASDTLRVVTFNVRYGMRVDSAIAALSREPGLRGADVVLLQEMDDAGTRRVAAALGMAYAYYPAMYHVTTERDFGEAILSRWPIVDAEKLILPHHGWLNRTQRIAVAATIRVSEKLVRVYSVHLATAFELPVGARRAQLRAVIRDAAAWPRVILGGDLNSGDVGGVALAAGFLWPTRAGPRTTFLGRWDHVFLKGFALPDSAAAGTGANHHASDHRPVWARAILP